MASSGLIIGLSGPTSSGKTSITSDLLSRLPSLVQASIGSIAQDDYYHSEEDSRHLHCANFGNITNWEVDSAFDMRKLRSDLQKRTTSLTVLEGITVFSDSLIRDLCHIRFFISLDYSICKTRRSTRSYFPFQPDPPGYFDGVIWPHHMDYRERIHENKEDYIFLDGEQPVHKTVDIIIEHLRQLRPHIFASI